MSNSSYVKKIHRFWAGRDMPDEYRRYGTQWEKYNPGWTVIDWDITALEFFPALRPILESLAERDAGRNGIEYFVQVADVFGYAILEKFGGIYVNCDIQPVRPLPELPLRAWASYENHEDGRIVNAAIGSPQHGDVFWWSLLRAMPERYFANPTAEMVETTGPAFLTDFAATRPDQLHVFPTETFNPVHWKQIAPGSNADGFDYPAETIGVHHWGHKRDGRSNTVETATQ